LGGQLDSEEAVDDANEVEDRSAVVYLGQGEKTLRVDGLLSCQFLLRVDLNRLDSFAEFIVFKAV
jgi:hypothetical protein